MKFTPSETFFSAEMDCNYCKGFIYDSEASDKLKTLAAHWMEDNKVKIVADGIAGYAHMSGKGSVH